MSALLIRGGVPRSAGRRLRGDAIAIADGRIVAIGSAAELRDALPVGTTEIDARGGLVTPGFVDAHLHLGVVATDSLRCDLAGAASLEEIDRRIRAFAAGSHAAWILGGGWDRALFRATGPTTQMLDRLVPDRPAMLHDADHHAAWVNSEALRRAGIDASTPDPADGRIARLADGSPSGFLAEGALQLLVDVLPASDPDELATAIGAASSRLLDVGITGWQEAALGAFGGFPDFTDAYLLALGRRTLRGRPTGAVWVPRDLDASGIDDFVAHCLERRDVNGAAGFPTTTAKLMLDGIVESRTASMLEAYEGHPGEVGLSYFPAELIRRLIPALNAAGIAVHVHAIGDRAVRDALDGFAAVPAEHRGRVRNHIAHLQVIAPEDVSRFGELGVTANLQPYWACETPLAREATLPLLGAGRAARLYVFRSLLDTGAPIAMGSDWPVSEFDPWQGLHVAVNRRLPGDTTTPALGPDQALPLEVALDAYTRGSAELIGLDGGGRLEPGAPADLVIANRDPFSGPSADIHLTRTATTILGGEVV